MIVLVLINDIYLFLQKVNVECLGQICITCSTGAAFELFQAFVRHVQVNAVDTI